MEKLERCVFKVRAITKDGKSYTLDTKMDPLELSVYGSWEHVKKVVSKTVKSLEKDMEVVMALKDIKLNTADGKKIDINTVDSWFVTARFYTAEQYNTDKGLSLYESWSKYPSQF